MTDFSLAHLTVLSLPPPQMITVAARSGYRYVGLRLVAVTADSAGYPLMDDRGMMRDTKRRLADTGLRVLDIELIRLTPEIDISAFEPMLAAGAELGARHVITAPYDPDLTRLADRLGALADLSAIYDIGPVLEFFPWTDVSDLRVARSIVQATARRNAGILVDTLHFDRSGSWQEDLDTIPPKWLPFVHVCDAPAAKPSTTEEILYTARVERLPPGEGGIDIRGIMRHMPLGIPVALEVPMTALTQEKGPEEVARRAIAGARRVLEGA
jgi:sugar phosphate isomerase/epimerase